ncbi:MAG TPA: STAS/SEC14 domain-containing protein [Chitinispirillaceae bacterium]|nr:STAS/SEC14 domain-containing protein [Chitinispirillaceae bacterium]
MIQKLNWSHDNIAAYEASGILTKEENLQIFDELRNVIRKCGKVRLFVRLPRIAFPEFQAISTRLKFAREHLKDIERYALVTNNTFLKTFSTIALFMPWMKFRSFNLNQEKIAQEWIESNNIKCKPDIIVITSISVLMIALLIVILKYVYKKVTSNNDSLKK